MNFYGVRVPEIRTLAKRLHEEHGLKEFYTIFNKYGGQDIMKKCLWHFILFSFMKNEFDLDTWKFLKPHLKDIKNLGSD